MVFSSMTFLFAFLPITLLLYFPIKNRVWRNIVLLVVSLVFYAWGEPVYVLLMLAASAVAYAGGLLVHRWREKKTLCKTVFIITVSLLVLNLLVFKYLNFFFDNLNYLFHFPFTIAPITLPIGISFYTFQILSYVIDLYRQEIHVQKNFFYLTLYVSFFPQLIAGPIVRYQTIEDEILGRKETWEDIVAGSKRFMVGLAKKVILANNIALAGNIIYAGDPPIYGAFLYWVAAAAYALQIYFDFSGYSDMAIGLGRIFGFHFLENFRYPYISTSITDFWRRWHISLSTWFRDYIYIPLGGNRTAKWKWIRNIFVVWALTGFWHGAQWNFIFWGIYYCALLLLEKVFLGKWLQKLPKGIQWIYTMFFVLIGWVLFNRTEMSQLSVAFSTMFSFTPTDWTQVIAADASLVSPLLFMLLGILCMFPISEKIHAWKGSQTAVFTAVSNVAYFALLLLSIVMIISSSYNPFIYFRF